MSIRLPPPASVSDPTSDSESHSSSSESDDDNDQTWDDWDPIPTPNSSFPSAEAALAYDKETHQFSLEDICTALSLDFHGRVRLINYIRTEPFFTSDEYLVPVVENDPLLRIRKIKALERKLALAQQSLGDYDKVRTSTYAHFILTNPTLFRNAIVLDVGCGTGILSLFAARAGAKRVIAVDASNIAEKAEKIVKANGFEDVITVVRGKIENITLPADIDKVDIIISEWMGYALLYESMLDSVLHARDRFLKPGGVMAPSQCKMISIGFWEDVYGFDLSVMATELYDEAIVDVVGPEALLSKPYPVKILNRLQGLLLGEITIKELDFSTPFTLVSTTERRTKVSAFVLYFDTFFTQHGGPVPPSTEVKIVKEGEAVLAELWPVGGKSALHRRQSMGRDKAMIRASVLARRARPRTGSRRSSCCASRLLCLKDPLSLEPSNAARANQLARVGRRNSLLGEDRRGSAPSETFVQMYKIR
ncbi:arginine N-methyltransferase 3 [Pholiota molesta]|nr:arginine N-methyltransferase 3 [Pholiota molesta]